MDKNGKQTPAGFLTLHGRLHEAFDGLIEGCLLLGPDFRYLYVNESAARHGRRSPESMVGSLLEEVYPGIERTALFATLRRCMLERTPCRLEIEFIYPDGARAWFDASIQPRYQGLFVQSIDITEKKRAELALRESNERFSQLADTIEEVFWLTDVAKGTIVYVSPGYEKIWGRTCQSLYDNPRDWIEAIHFDDRERVLHAALTKQALGTYDEEYRIVRPDGDVRWIRDRGLPVLDARGVTTRVAGSAQDITQRRELEAQLLQTQKLESIGMLAGGIAHDFNNLLTVISSSSHEMLELIDPDDESMEALDDINRACERAKGLTRQLLSFSRREVVAPKVIELSVLVSDTEKMLRRLLGEDVLVALSLGPDHSCVKIDAGNWVQVLMNLAVNARDAMPRGGKLEIETGRVVFGEGEPLPHPKLSPGVYATLTMRDSGTGMTSQVMSRAFEPFFTTKGLGRGTGMGLSVVHGIVAQSGGHIEVSSEVGVGTTFRLYIPEVYESPSDSVRARAKAGSTGTETILLVEDEDAIRKIAVRALQRQGYSVLFGNDGTHALELAEAHRGKIDLLVTDVVMPHMDGRALAEALRARHPELRVLFTSGYTDDAVVRYGIQHSEVEYLPKPYDLADLRHKVRDVLDGP